MDKKIVNKYKEKMSEWQATHKEDYQLFLELVQDADNGGSQLIERMCHAVTKKWWYFPIMSICFKKWLPEKLRSHLVEYAIQDAGVGLKKRDGSFVCCCLYWLYMDGGALSYYKILERSKENCNDPFQVMILSLLSKTAMSVIVKNNMTTKTKFQEEIKRGRITSCASIAELKRIDSPNRGRNFCGDCIEDILKDRNKDKVIGAIGKLIQERTSDTQLAYILFGLKKGELLVNPEYEYAPFHRALQKHFPNNNIGDARRAQKMFSNLIDGGDKMLGKRQLVEYQEWSLKVSSTIGEALQ